MIGRYTNPRVILLQYLQFESLDVETEVVDGSLVQCGEQRVKREARHHQLTSSVVQGPTAVTARQAGRHQQFPATARRLLVRHLPTLVIAAIHSRSVLITLPPK